MAAVHNSNKDQDSSNSQRNGTASPGGWHFPKSGLGTPDLFYSFSSTQQHHGPTTTSVTTGGGGSSSSGSTTQPAWFKPQGVAASNANKASSNTQASTSSSTTATAAVKKEEPDAGAGAGDDDDGDNADRSNAGNQQSKLNSKDNTGNEEANRNVRALSDPPVRQSPAWIFPAAGFGPHKTHLEQEPNPFEHSFSSRPEDASSANLQFAQAINNAVDAGGVDPNGHSVVGTGYHNGYPSNAYFNNGGGAAVGGNNQYEIGPPRRARSQSPKSAGWQHSTLNPSQQHQRNNHFNHAYQDTSSSSYLGANLFGSNSKGGGGAFGNISTPSSELPSFGWAFDNNNNNHRSGGPSAGSSINVPPTAPPSHGIFDPTSIRTGLTPGVSDGNKHHQPPHSPATQALFAMMTNATPGGDIAAHFGGGSSTNSNRPSQAPSSSTHSGLSAPPPIAGGLLQQPPNLGDASRTSSNNSSSSNSIPQVSTTHQGQNNNTQGMYSQAVPRPMQPQGPYNNNNTHQQQKQHLHSSYQGGNPSYLQQNVPRPFPSRAFDSTQSSEASSSQSVPQINTHQQQQAQNRGGGAGDHNPLYLLSQHAQDGQSGQPLPPHLQHQPQSIPPNAVQRLQHPHHSRNLSDSQQGAPGAASSHNEDAMLAAAALSGLSTPRPAYVGGPSPLVTVNPGSINPSQPVPNLVQPPLGRVKPIPPPASLFHEQKPSALTKENMKANNARAGSSSAVPNNKKGSTAGNNKRKKGATATPEPSTAAADEASKSKVRRTSRRTAATTSTSQQQQQPPSSSQQQQQRQQSFAELPDSGGEDEIESRYLPGGNDAAGMGLDGDMGGDSDDDDMMSNNGSFNGSRDGMGGSQAGDGSGVSPPRKGGRGPKQHFATEEEKRKNFLERNRQAALKCRQRKKQWLTQLQSKVEYLTADNETLHVTVSRLREEAANLRAILGAHSDCQLTVPPGPAGPGGVTTVGAYLHGVQQQQQQGPSHGQQHSQRQY